MKQKKSILDAFCKISNEEEAKKPDLCVKLYNHLTNVTKTEPDKVNENGVLNELNYMARRLIQGLGSPRTRNCYFATLVCLIQTLNGTRERITLQMVKDIADKSLNKAESKGEVGEVLIGRTLAFGAAMRSNIFSGTDELQKGIITEMLTKTKERSYLPPLTFEFITFLINSIDEEKFNNIVWPVLKEFVLIQWPDQNIDTINCLLAVENRYPKFLKKKTISQFLNTPSIIDESTIGNLENILFNNNWNFYKHPIYHTLTLTFDKKKNSKLLKTLWNRIETAFSEPMNRLKLLSIISLFSAFVKGLNLELLPELITTNFINLLIGSISGKQDQHKEVAKDALQSLVTRITEKSADKSFIPNIAYKILHKFLIETQHMLIDKETGIKIVYPIVAQLDTEHVKLLTEKCENIILKLQSNEALKFTFKDRSYACQLLTRLINHPAVQSDIEWKIKYLKVILKHALFTWNTYTKENMSDELASILRQSFFSALSHLSVNLENHRAILKSLVEFINDIINDGEYKFRSKKFEKILKNWSKPMKKIKHLDKKISKTEDNTIISVFQMLYLQMILYYFTDVEVAENVLNDLEKCYAQIKIKKGEQADCDDDWMQSTINVLITLLSSDTYMLRHLISKTFPKLCPHLTAQAAFHILDVFNPSKNDVITGDGCNDEGDDDDDDDDGDDDDGGGGGDDENGTEENIIEDDSDSDINVDDQDDVEDTILDRRKNGLRDALSMTGSVSDAESIDVDDIDDDEGRRLDAVLEQVFKSTNMNKNHKNKKQSPNDKALTNFRIRVLDLVDIYLTTDTSPPSLGLVLDTIPVMLKLLEFTIKDKHQLPLENRVRTTIKKIGHLKNCTEIDKIDDQYFDDIFKMLTEKKGNMSSPVFLALSEEIVECCTFLVRIHIQRVMNKNSTKSTFYNIFSTALHNFFTKRDCLLPLSLFENIITNTNWTQNEKLCQQIMKFSFSDTVRGFRRHQGLLLITAFYKNTRLLTTLKESNSSIDQIEKMLLKNTSKIFENRDHPVKMNFLSELFSLLISLKQNRFVECDESRWSKFRDDINKYLQDKPNVSKNGLGKEFMKLCKLLEIQTTVISEKEQLKNSDVYMESVPRVNGNEKSKNDDKKKSSDDIVNGVTTDHKHKKSKKRKGRGIESREAKRLRLKLANELL